MALNPGKIVIVGCGRVGSTLAQNLPPFYTQSVQVAPAQVLSQDLINAVKNSV